MTLAERIKDQLLQSVKAEMMAKDISQAEVARRLGALRRNINQLLGEKKSFTLDYLLKIAQAIDLDVEIKVKRLKK